MSEHNQRVAWYQAKKQQKEIDLLAGVLVALLEDEPEKKPVKTELTAEELKRRKEEQEEMWSYG